MKQNLLLATILLSIIYSCKKDDTNITFTLPAKTQSGKNSFGFLNNSLVWTNYGQVCFPFAGGCRVNLKGTFYQSDGDIYIHADRVLEKVSTGHTMENIDLYLNTKFKGTQTYSTANKDSIGIGYYFTKQGEPMKTYFQAKSNPSLTIIITKLDTINNILSGEFSGKLFRRISDYSFETSTTDSIILEDGRFDLKLK